MQQIISGLMKPKFNASNVEFILSLTLHVDVGSVAWCIRQLADAEIPSCVSSVERFQNGTYVVYAVSAIAFIGIYLHVSRSASVVGRHCLNYELHALEPSPNFITSVR